MHASVLGTPLQVMDFVMEEVEEGLHTLLEKIKPALEQVPCQNMPSFGIM